MRAFLAIAFLALVATAAAVDCEAPPAVPAVTFTHVTLQNGFTNMIGIDYHAPSASVIFSANYPSGNPFNFASINQAGVTSQFSDASGQTDEVKIASVWPEQFHKDQNLGGFTVGDMFTGNGNGGQILKITNNGNTVINPWVSLPGETGLLRGSLYHDRTGVWDHDLIVVTNKGGVWRVTSAGVPTKVAQIGSSHLEGVITVPVDEARYGILSGKIIIGMEAEKRIGIVSTDGSFEKLLMPSGVAIEDIDMIVEGANWFGVDYGNKRILGLPASSFNGFHGDILVNVEFMHNNGYGNPSGLWILRWDSCTSSLQVLPIPVTFDFPEQWEHMTFSPAGISEIPSVPLCYNQCTFACAMSQTTTVTIDFTTPDPCNCGAANQP